ncbi:MAG: adenylate/guanylate cyclase domain-containing protein [Candidatus Marinimicrobia bacterium]|nr:adenylate/guanylate cyclase domain-containing protein [Candidatus Neomarinimicrobiota bacterium]
MPTAIKRKLAAIMFTDIVGYTSMSAKDESKAIALIDLHRELISPIISKFNGTIHKEMGDGLLLSFSTVTEAVQCGVNIQESIRKIEELNLRIGIHEGEITLKNGDVLGDDVNITSRIVPYSPIGGIAISEKIQQNISSLPDYKFNFIGRPKLKGIPMKLKLFTIASHGLPSKSKLKLRKSPAIIIGCLSFSIMMIILLIQYFSFNSIDSINSDIPSVTIMPPEIISAQANNQIIRSIAEDLIINISTYSGGEIILPSINDVLNVNEKLPRKIANQLNSKFVLESSLSISDRDIELRCRLLDTVSGKSPYSKSMKSTFRNLSVILEIISIGVVNSLNINVVTPHKQELTPMDFSETL